MVDATRIGLACLLPIVILLSVEGVDSLDGPPKPKDLVATPVSAKAIKLTWDVKSAFNSSRPARFILRYSGGLTTSWKTANDSVPSSARSFVFSFDGSIDSFGYVFKVTSVYDDTGRKTSEETIIPVHPRDSPKTDPPPPDNANFTCHLYKGSRCAGLLTHGYFYVENGDRPDDDRKEALAGEVLAKLGDECVVEKRMACDMIFVPCHPLEYRKRGVGVARPVCRQDCRSVADGACGATFLESIGVQCDDLPPANGGEWPECLRYDTKSDGGIDDRNSTDCYYGDGQGYEGKVRVDQSARTCELWYNENLRDEDQIFFGYNSSVVMSWENFCRNPQGRGVKPWCYTSTDRKSWAYCTIPKCGTEIECQTYDLDMEKGSMCTDMFGFRDYKVAINEGRLSMFDANKEIIEVAGDEDLKGEDTCKIRKPALSLLCHQTMPFCEAQNASLIHRLCRETCESWSQYTCGGKVLGELLQDVISEKSIDDKVKNIVHNCALLPEKNGGGEPECIDLPPPPSVAPTTANQTSLPPETDCYYGSGENYVGNVSVANASYECAFWNSTTPHFHPFVTPSIYPNLADNYCRNPGNRGKKPWCYTKNPNVRWAYCDVLKCTPTTQPSTVDDPEAKQEATNNAMIAAIAGVLGGIIVVCLIVFFEVRRRHKKRRLHQVNAGPVRLLSRGRSNSSAMENNPLYMEKIACPEICVEKVVRLSDLGEGNFGKVFKGEIRGLVDDATTTIVAVKTLKADSNDEMRRDFYREALLMSNFNHPNIVRLLGVSTDSMGPVYLLFEYMALGDLNKYLFDNAGNYHRKSYYYNSVGGAHSQSSTLSDTLTQKPSLSIEQLIQIATQIAAGMSYLAHRRYVHRDLATRNCLVAEGLVVKIADFGMSQDIYSMDYYRVGGAALLPVRWMPPEAILYGKSTVFSDVWSFGVVLWEIFSFAMQPYYGLSNEEVVDAVRKGRQLGLPDDCPPQIYHLMKACWSMEPEERPAFKKLHRQLSDWNPALMSGSLANAGTSVTTCDQSATGESGAEDPAVDDVFDGSESLTVQLPPIGKENDYHCNGKVAREGTNGVTVNGNSRITSAV